MQGRITKQISNQYTVTTDTDNLVCTARGKFRHDKLTPLVGDLVEFDQFNQIIKILPRKNELSRPNVANIDVVLIVTSIKKPDLSLSLLDREITVIYSAGIEPVICFTKLDLASKDDLKEVKILTKYYKNIGINVFDNKHLNKLKRYLKKKTVVLTGQTGAGKSSLLNKLSKDLNLETKEISSALNRGVHTTRHSEIYLVSNIYFVDTPGFSSLDLGNITVSDLKSCFKEFDKLTCKYEDCNHLNEDGCEVKSALEKGEILPSRYINYTRFYKEIYENNSKLYK